MSCNAACCDCSTVVLASCCTRAPAVGVCGREALGACAGVGVCGAGAAPTALAAVFVAIDAGRDSDGRGAAAEPAAEDGVAGATGADAAELVGRDSGGGPPDTEFERDAGVAEEATFGVAGREVDAADGEAAARGGAMALSGLSSSEARTLPRSSATFFISTGSCSKQATQNRLRLLKLSTCRSSASMALSVFLVSSRRSALPRMRLRSGSASVAKQSATGCGSRNGARILQILITCSKLLIC